MTKYKCGHNSKGFIIMDANVLSYICYEEWGNSVGIFGDKSQCFECWNKELRESVSYDDKRRMKK